MDEQKDPCIIQQAEEDALYTKLQTQTLEEVQRLAGKVWTDYNVHDPGVTTGDITNHALVELDYKLGFPLTDYCVEKGGAFVPGRFGLFLPEEVYTTQPVPVEDYRRLFLAHIPELDNVRVECDLQTGGYTIKALLSPFGTKDGKAVCEQIKALYHRHRNLCEYLSGEVEILKPDELEFHAEFGIEPGEDASVVLARLYATILRYLSGVVQISAPEMAAASGLSPEEWLEGVTDSVRPVVPALQQTEHELYKQLREVEGVRSFTTCYLMKDGEPQTDFSQGFGLQIPTEAKELHVRIRQGYFEVEPDFFTFRTRLEALYQASRHRQPIQPEQQKTCHWSLPNAVYRDIFAHDSIMGDFPACYRLSEKEGQGQTAFESYLKLYDQVIQNGLLEVKELPRILSLEAEDAGNLTDLRIRALKKQYLDFLDKMYGVESHPVWLSEQNCYGETEEGTLWRRMNFMRHIACLTGNRSRARDILLHEEESDPPVIKEWFCRLLGLESSDEYTVSNVLPKHNLRIVDRKAKKSLTERIDSLLIDERMLEEDKMEKIDYEELAADEAEKLREYGMMRSELDYFNVNRISGDLFRGGTDLENYRTVQLGKEEYMLMYHNRERVGWTNLGCAGSRERLNTLANILRRFLRELNRACETVYIVEPVLADTDRPFRLMLVLPAWTGRFHVPRFRENSKELLCSLLPAHLSIEIYWLNEHSMKKFESCYHQWIRSLTDYRMGDYKKLLLSAMDELLNPTTKKDEPDDTD